MTNLKSIYTAIIVISLGVLTVSCNGSGSKGHEGSQETAVKSDSDTTYEDGGSPRARNEKTAAGNRKDSSAVGPVAPKAPPHGGRADHPNGSN